MMCFLCTSVHGMASNGERGPGSGMSCVGFAGVPTRILECPRGHRVVEEFRVTPTITTPGGVSHLLNCRCVVQAGPGLVLLGSCVCSCLLLPRTFNDAWRQQFASCEGMCMWKIYNRKENHFPKNRMDKKECCSIFLWGGKMVKGRMDLGSENGNLVLGSAVSSGKALDTPAHLIHFVKWE